MSDEERIVHLEPKRPLGEWNAGQDTGPIPPRQWILGNTFARGYLSSLQGSGGTGKSALRCVQALSVATGRSLVGEHVFERMRVLFVSFEDDRDEARRRVRAALVHHGVSFADIDGWLFLATPGMAAGKIAQVADTGALKIGTLGGFLRETIGRLGVGLAILDPLVKTHSVNENSNQQIDTVASVLAQIAADLNVAIDLPHHVAKGAPDPGNSDRGRGASAFRDAARIVHTLTAMSPEEAATFNLGEAERRALVRLDSGKVNIAPPAAAVRWFKLVGVAIGNITETYPNGDNVQTVETWTPPDVFVGTDNLTLNKILTAIAAGLPNGQRYSDASAAGNRAAWKVIQDSYADKSEAQCREMVRCWLRTGLLFREQYDDPVERKKRSGLRVNAAKRPTP